jgi:hypothetical protein
MDSKQQHARLILEAETFQRAAEIKRAARRQQKMPRRSLVGRRAYITIPCGAKRLRQKEAGKRKFEALCLRVQRNDPSTTVVANVKSFPVDYQYRLGKALKKQHARFCNGCSFRNIDSTQSKCEATRNAQDVGSLARIYSKW